MEVLLHNKPRKAKKKKNCNADADVNTDADADIYKWSRETTVGYLGKKIQVQKIESEHYS